MRIDRMQASFSEDNQFLDHPVCLELDRVYPLIYRTRIQSGIRQPTMFSPNGSNETKVSERMMVLSAFLTIPRRKSIRSVNKSKPA